MATLGWNEQKPVGTDIVSELDETWRSIKTAVRTGLEEHFHWNDSQSSAGEPKYSTSTPGSCRVYHGARSAVSNPARPGAAMALSNESRLVVFESGDSVVVGGHNIVTSKTEAEETPNSRRVCFFDSSNISTGEDSFISFPSTFTNNAETAPTYVLITPSASVAASSASYLISLNGIDTSGFTASIRYIGPSADPEDATVHWYSEGTLPL